MCELTLPCTTNEPRRAWIGTEHCNLQKGNITQITSLMLFTIGVQAAGGHQFLKKIVILFTLPYKLFI